jgi:hypothetical protein
MNNEIQMTDQVNVDDFLAHFGVPGMKWGRRRSTSSDHAASPKSNFGGAKPKMSKQKKIAIAAGVGAVVVVGAAIALSVMNKIMDLPAGSLIKHASTAKGSKAHQEHEKRIASVTERLRNEKASPLKTRGDLDRYRVESRDKMLKDQGLTLSPSIANRDSARRMGTPSTPNLNTYRVLLTADLMTFFKNREV